MESTTRLHDGVANAVLQETYLVFDHPIAFHTPNRVFDADSDRRDRTVVCFLRGGEFAPPGFLLRLDDGDPVEDKALEAPILIEATAVWQGIALQFSQGFLMHRPFIRGTQEANGTGLIDHKEVFDRVALLLTAVMILLLFESFRAMDRPLCTIMPKRGGVDSPFAWAVLRKAAKSSAVRAGSRSGWAKA
jgi:hypothetical protein